MITIFLYKTKYQSERETCMFKIYNDMNYKKFKKIISSADFSNMLLTLDPNSAFQNFYDHLILTYNRCFPIKKKIGRNVNRSGWITLDLKFCIGKKYWINLEMVRSLFLILITIEVFWTLHSRELRDCISSKNQSDVAEMQWGHGEWWMALFSEESWRKSKL